MDIVPPRTFVSYSHDSDEHKDRVLNLANRLRAAGVDCELDQYQQSPPGGWPRWMQQQIDQAQFVLVVCTATYTRRFNGDEPAGKGKGAKWEGAIITQELYDAEGGSTKFIPVVMDAADVANIPRVLRGQTYYDLSRADGFEQLYRRLTGQPDVRKPPLGTLEPMPARRREQQFAPIDATSAGTSAGRDHSAGKGQRPASQASREPTSQDLVLLVTTDGASAIGRRNQFQSAGDITTVQVEASGPDDTIFLSELRRRQGQELALTYRLKCMRGRIRSVVMNTQGDAELWTIEVQEDHNAGAMFTEVAYNGYSADQIAELRARHILLGQPMPKLGGLELPLLYTGPFVRKDSPIPELFNKHKHDPARFVALARLHCVFQLHVTGVVAHVHELEVKLENGDLLNVRFKGQRPRRYSNVVPVTIQIDGQFPLV